MKKSRVILLFGKGDYFLQIAANVAVVFSLVGAQATGAILNAIGGISEVAAAVFAQGVKGTIAKHTAKAVWVSPLMAGEIFTLSVLVEIVVRHQYFTPQENNGQSFL